MLEELYENKSEVVSKARLKKDKKQTLKMMFTPTKTVRNKNKIGRNKKCPCGSGKKYKKCCGEYDVMQKELVKTGKLK